VEVPDVESGRLALSGIVLQDVTAQSMDFEVEP
jgi:hypothetical protein